MKLQQVTGNNRKHVFEVQARGGRVFVFPYSRAEPSPSPDNRIREVYVDPELGREGFTYLLESGDEGSVHIDAVLEYNEDPTYMAELALYRLTLKVKEQFETSGLSVREVSRLLDTSPAQLYRLLDPTNCAKSVKQLIALLYALGAEVDLEVRSRPRGRSRTSAAQSQRKSA